MLCRRVNQRLYIAPWTCIIVLYAIFSLLRPVTRLKYQRILYFPRCVATKKQQKKTEINFRMFFPTSWVISLLMTKMILSRSYHKGIPSEKTTDNGWPMRSRKLDKVAVITYLETSEIPLDDDVKTGNVFHLTDSTWGESIRKGPLWRFLLNTKILLLKKSRCL